MRTLLTVSCILLFLTASGCSIYKAATAPEPLALENVKTGAQRGTIVSVLGIPKHSEVKQDSRTEVYEFVNGSPAGSKARIILYVAGDFFTLGLAELVFWPAELGFGQGTEGRAVVTYGLDDISRSVLLTKKDGTPWEFVPQEMIKKEE